MVNKNELLMENLKVFFNKKYNKDILINTLNNNYEISLRIIDWFVTNYCKKNNIGWVVDNTQFIVYINYKLQLKGYSKKYFDPFCRRDRIFFHYGEEKKNLITTVGQLNFFKWMIENNIIDYIKKNYIEIESDMHNTIKNTHKKKNKRRELSKSAIKTLNRKESTIILKFE